VLRNSSVRTNPSPRANSLAQSPRGPYAAIKRSTLSSDTSYSQIRMNTPRSLPRGFDKTTHDDHKRRLRQVVDLTRVAASDHPGDPFSVGECAGILGHPADEKALEVLAEQCRADDVQLG
jgi:hypothetical protein